MRVPGGVPRRRQERLAVCEELLGTQRYSSFAARRPAAGDRELWRRRRRTPLLFEDEPGIAVDQLTGGIEMSGVAGGLDNHVKEDGA